MSELLTTEDIDRMLAHAESSDLRDALLDIRNGERGESGDTPDA